MMSFEINYECSWLLAARISCRFRADGFEYMIYAENQRQNFVVWSGHKKKYLRKNLEENLNETTNATF